MSLFVSVKASQRGFASHTLEKKYIVHVIEIKDGCQRHLTGTKKEQCAKMPNH